jgi:hypothetical protein
VSAREAVPGDQVATLGRIVAALDAVGVEYMLTGSVAAALYVAEPRFTRDIDIVIKVTPQDAAPLQRVLQEDFDADPESIRDALRARSAFNVIDPEHLVKVDLIPAVSGIDREIARRQVVALGDVSVQVISPEDLVLAKLSWARESRSEVQMSDVSALLRRANTDHAYIRRRAVDEDLVALLDEAYGERHD